MKVTPPTVRDPVCGMEVAAADISVSVQWRGVIYRFCSEQCRERFVATPALYATTTPGPILKKRRLRFVASGSDALRQGCGILLGMMGICSAIPDGDEIAVEYDLRQVTLEQLERACAGSGLVLRSGLHGWRRALWRFQEENEIANAVRPADGACCNRPPAKAR